MLYNYNNLSKKNPNDYLLSVINFFKVYYNIIRYINK